ncbi:LysR substrate-binding domain-containing protein [Roseibium suaedae]|uniref:DNA-binding transcriptional regulator, LysR family n=1 Tax=Roseibium suaedae TaxID=735517 RepID=A0A1M7NQP1_9HYPH|nr:LysR substrate-binding domain-containing protein [Roseibium suaedae]SHN05724.1 DNA-binding transcriptional regulator, LysR family [Roseibium suaedae]
MTKRRRLPSFGSLATFEVAAKHLSFTKASSELNVTQAAVSQHIRLLEQSLSCKLFHRNTEGLELTWEGEYLLHSVAQGLDVLSNSIEALTGTQSRDTITISATTGVASLFLLPIISSFQEQAPEVEVIVLASDEDDSLRKYENVDFAFVCGNERSEVGSKIYSLFPEIVQPVCSPSYYEQNGPFPEAADLNRAQLIHLHEKHWSSKAIGWLPLAWGNWFKANGAELERQAGGMQSNSYPLLVDAAVSGKGVILGWKHLVAGHLKDGSLCYASPHALRVDRMNYVELGSREVARPWLQLFLDLVLAEAEKINDGEPGRPPVGASGTVLHTYNLTGKS